MASSAEKIEANLKAVGRWELDAPGSYGDVAVVGTTAAVATEAGAPCPVASVHVLDLKKPKSPRAVSTIPVPPGMTVADMDATTVLTERFTGDVVALALAPAPGCAGGSGSLVTLHDVTDPTQPRSLGQMTGCPGCGAGAQSVSLAQRSDGMVVMARTTVAPAGVAVDDVSDPTRPVPLSVWRDPGPAEEPGGCVPTGGSPSILVHGDATEAIATFADGRIYHLDLTDPKKPSGWRASEAGAPGAAHTAVLPLGKRTVAVVSEEQFDDACSDTAPTRGLRVLTLERGAPPREEAPVRFPTASAPGRVIGSGALAYVAWRGDGLRIVDFGEVKARVVAQFAPARPEVVGVGLLPEHLVITDRGSGLYVLERPTEGGGRASFWSQFLSFLPYLGFAVLAAAALLVPRLVPVVAGSGAALPSPVGQRRRA